MILHLSTYPLTSWGRSSERAYLLFPFVSVEWGSLDWARWYLTFNGNIKRPIHSQLNWAILLCDVMPDGKTEYCVVLTGNSAGLRTVLSSRLSHTELRSSLRESNSFLSLPADTTMASSQGNHFQHPFLAIHSADEHRMIYSFSSTTSYFTFYAFFSSFRITLWPMLLANSKR